MKKSIKALSVLALTMLLASCGGTPTTSVDPTTQEQPTVQPTTAQTQTEDPTSETPVTSETPTSVTPVDQDKLKEIVLKDGVETKIQSTVTMTFTSFFELVANPGEKVTQKLITIESADPTIVEISGSSSSKKLTGLNVGKTMITVTSTENASKKLEVEFEVTPTFFDHSMSVFDARDDVSHEADAENPYVRTQGCLNDADLIVKTEALTKGYFETEVTIHGTGGDDNFPKMWIGHVVPAEKTYEQTGDNKVYFFLNEEKAMEIDPKEWDWFGIVERYNGTLGWQYSVDDSIARHVDHFYQRPAKIGFEQKFKLGMARDGYFFDYYVDDVYVGSSRAQETLLAGADGINAAEGYFSVGSFYNDATYSNYKVLVGDAANDKIVPEANKMLCTTWDEKTVA